jgi:hypothetical protein
VVRAITAIDQRQVSGSLGMRIAATRRGGVDMKSVWIAVFAAAVGFGSAASSVANAGGKARVVNIDQIPMAARAALMREARGAPIRRVEIKENATTVYEGLIQRGTDEVGVTVDATGYVFSERTGQNEHPRGRE